MDWPYFCFLLLTHSIVDGQSVDWPANPLNWWPIHQLAGQSIIFKANPWIGQAILLHLENVDWPKTWIGRTINDWPANQWIGLIFASYF